MTLMIESVALNPAKRANCAQRDKLATWVKGLDILSTVLNTHPWMFFCVEDAPTNDS